MSRNVKKSPEKILSVDGILSKILKDKGLDIEKFAVEVGISIDALRKSIERDVLSKKSVQKIRDRFQVSEAFLQGYESELSYEKHTLVQNEAAVTSKQDTAQIINTLFELEKVGDYRFVPKKLLDDYDLFPKADTERRAKERDKTIEAMVGGFLVR